MTIVEIFRGRLLNLKTDFRFSSKQINPRFQGSWCVKGTEEFTLGKDSLVPLTLYDPSDLELICWVKKRKIRFRIQESNLIFLKRNAPYFNLKIFLSKLLLQSFVVKQFQESLNRNSANFILILFIDWYKTEFLRSKRLFSVFNNTFVLKFLRLCQTHFYILLRILAAIFILSNFTHSFATSRPKHDLLGKKFT